jgi:hypothetical protein
MLFQHDRVNAHTAKYFGGYLIGMLSHLTKLHAIITYRSV